MDYIIRPVKSEDTASVAELRSAKGVFETILSLPSSRSSQTKDFLENLDENMHVFVAVLPDGKVIGNISLITGKNPRKHHVGTIGMMVHPDFQGMKIGTKLMETILDLADNWLMLKRVELSVFSDNKYAIRLYERFGFIKEGTNIMATIKNGVYADEDFMARIKA